MPYKFGEYVSTYVDPQSVRISETLRERFLSNFQANDQLTMAVEQMQAASAFENDVTRKKELQRQTENALAQLAERGDYENLGFQIHRTAKQFAKDYAPIEENYKRYQGALQEVSKAYEKGDINAEYAQLYKNYMTRGYKGFEIDEETGRPKEGTMFSAPGIVKDPKVFDRIKKTIEIIKPEKYANKNMNVAQGPDGMYKVTVEGSSEGIEPEVVQKAIDMVMAEPDVKAYVGQMSDMQAYNLYSQGRIPEVLQNQASTISSNIDNLTKAIESGKLNTATKKQYINTVAKLRSELDTINNIAQDEQASYQYVSNRIANDMFRPMEEFVLEAASYQNVSQSRMIDYDQKWLQDRQAAIDAEAALGTSIYKQGEVTAKDIYGTTLEQKQNLITSTYDEMVANEKIANDVSVNEETREAARQKAAAAKTTIGDIRKQIELAANKTMSIQDLERKDPKLIQAIREAFPWATTPGQVLLKMQDVFNNTSDSNPEYVKVNNAFKNKFNEGLNEYVKVRYMPAAVGESYGITKAEYEKLPLSKRSLDMDIHFDVTDEPYKPSKVAVPSLGGAGLGATTATIAINPFDAFTENFKEDINYNFSQLKESNLFNYGKIDVGDPKATTAFTKAVDDFFLNKPLAEDQTVLDVTKDGVQEISGKDLKGYTVIDRGWNKNNNLWELQLKNDKGEVKTVHYEGRNITSPVIQSILSQNDVKFSKIASSMNSRVTGEKGITTREIGLLDSTGTYTNTKIILSSEILSNGDQVFSVRGVDGKPLTDSQGNVFLDKKYRMTDKEFKDLILARQLMPGDNPNNPTGPPIVELIN
jgi:hypothetical protein